LMESGNAYNVCFIDLRMPVMDGIALSRAITARPGKKPAIIIISAYDWNPIEQEAKAAGVIGFMSKPLFASDIEEFIKSHVGADRDAETDNAEDMWKKVFKGRRILMAEDVEINREVVLTLLEPTQLEIECAFDGAEAVRLFNAAPERYDLILMDMQMPIMDGLSATRHIRALDFAKAREIPIVAMTANVFREDVEQCLKAGMNDHIGKPIDYNELLSKIKMYLRPRKSALIDE